MLGAVELVNDKMPPADQDAHASWPFARIMALIVGGTSSVHANAAGEVKNLVGREVRAILPDDGIGRAAVAPVGA